MVVPSELHEASFLPSVETARDMTQVGWPSSSAMSLPDSTSQSLSSDQALSAFLSYPPPPLIRVFPSGEKASVLTAPLSVMADCSLRLATSQSLTFPLVSAEARRRLSLLTASACTGCSWPFSEPCPLGSARSQSRTDLSLLAD